MHRHQVGHPHAEQRVQPFERVVQHGGKVVALGPAQVAQKGRGPLGQHPGFVGVAGKGRHQAQGVRALTDQAQPGLLFLGHELCQPGPSGSLHVGAHGVQCALLHGRDMVVSINLAVRMVQRDAHLDAPVFEGQHVLYTLICAQHRRAVCPHVDQQPDLLGGQAGERGVRILGEHHHLAAPHARPHRHARNVHRCGRVQRQAGKTVLEHRHVVCARRQLGGVGGVHRGGQGVVPRRRQKGAALAVRGVHHPLAPQRVPAQLRRGRHRVAGAGNGAVYPDGLAAAVEGQRAPVGLEVVGLNHGRARGNRAPECRPGARR